MSFDFSLEKICTHETLFERVSIDTNRSDTIRIPRPPFNSSVRLYIDGVEISKSGITTPAELPFSKSEPYRIISGQSDLLYLKVDSGTPRFIQLLTGTNLKAVDVARDLIRKIPDLSISVKNKRILFSSTHMEQKFSFQDPRWTDKTSSLPSTLRVLNAYGNIGIVPGRVATSRRIFPSWQLVPDDESPLPTSAAIRFDSPILNQNPVFQVSYFTDASNCRRCGGIRIEFDYTILNGGYEEVTDADLLAQEFDKFVFTASGSHFKWPWLGSKLLDRIGGKGNGKVVAGAMITMDISQAFKTYQNIKSQQDTQFPTQQVTDAEFPYDLKDISVQQLPSDPTVAMVVVSITSRSREPITLKRLVGNPNPFSLAADPSQAIRLANQSTFLLRG